MGKKALTWPPKWPLLTTTDYFVHRDGSQTHIIHQGHCMRAMTPDGLCLCVDPETYKLRP